MPYRKVGALEQLWYMLKAKIFGDRVLVEKHPPVSFEVLGEDHGIVGTDGFEKSKPVPADCPWPENHCTECWAGTAKGCLGPRGDVGDVPSNRY